MRVLLFANTDWFLWNFKLALARALRARGDEVILMSPPGPFGERLRAEGFAWEPIALSRSGINPLQELGALRRLLSRYRALKPDVVHHFTIKCVIYGSLAARRAGVSHVINSVTGLGFALLADTFKARLIRPVVVGLYRWSLRGSTVIFQNADNRETLSRLGCLTGVARADVVPGDGVDTAHFRPPEAEPERPGVLMMARLLWSKGVGEFVAAAALVRARHPEVRFLLAGAADPGNPESVDAASIARWKSDAIVELLGQRSDVVALQQGCSIAVLASTQGEGMPRALLEAAACARPMVATDVPGCRELVQSGVNGLLVPPGDAAALAQAILALLDDAERAREMGRKARARVEAELSDERINARTLALYPVGPNPSAPC
ncbi:glycosyltransferase family 4 protein [Niveibacterium sp. SC-1]|uniref:glycosyltransferase family 4 protein n=1 Tax=Niveibacterium sp. SC-1 TaxID=3135646 RepID=UPI00311D7F8A